MKAAKYVGTRFGPMETSIFKVLGGLYLSR